jgi:hypothetical protein
MCSGARTTRRKTATASLANETHGTTSACPLKLAQRIYFSSYQEKSLFSASNSRDSQWEGRGQTHHHRQFHTRDSSLALRMSRALLLLQRKTRPHIHNHQGSNHLGDSLRMTSNLSDRQDLPLSVAARSYGLCIGPE